MQGCGSRVCPLKLAHMDNYSQCYLFHHGKDPRLASKDVMTACRKNNWPYYRSAPTSVALECLLELPVETREISSSWLPGRSTGGLLQ